MKQLWDDMGYKNLQLKSQNLRDQASRLEKIRNNGTDLSIRERSVEDLGISHLQVNILVRKILKVKVKTKTEKVEMLILHQEA